MSLCIEVDNLTSHILDHSQANLSPVLSGPTVHIPWSNIATLYSNWSKADFTHRHLLVHLSLQLHNSIKFDYYIIYMKHYVWILMKRKAQNLYMICVSPVNYSLLITHAKQTDPHYMLAAPIQCKILPLAIWNKALASLATHFGVQKSTV